MLNGTLVCHDARCERKARCHPGCIRDVEAFCAKVIRESGFRFTADYGEDDLLSELVEAIWQLETLHDPARGSLSTYASGAAKNKITDAARRRFRTKWVFSHKTYERPEPVILNIDALKARDVETSRLRYVDRLDHPVGTAALDSEELSGSLDEWLDAPGGISPAAYRPPRYLGAARGVCGARDDEADRDELQDREAA